MAQYDGSLKFDTKINTSGFVKGLKGLKNAAGKTFGAMKKSVEVVGGVLAGASAGVVALIESTKELNGDLGKFQANVNAAGKNQQFMNEQLKRFTAITGEADSSVEGLSNLLRTTYKEERLTQVLNNLAGAVVAFPDTLKFESLSDSLQETLATGKGVGQFAELLERSGLNLEKFDEEMANAKTQMDKNTIALNYLNRTGLAELAKNYEEANKEQLDYSKNQQELQQQVAELSGQLVPIINTIFPVLIQILGKVKDKIVVLINPVKDFLKQFVDMVNGVEGAGQDLVQAISSILANVKAKVIELVPKVVDEIKGIITKATDFMKSEEGKKALGEAMQTMFSDALALLKELPDLISKIGEFLGSVVDAFFDDQNFDKLGQGLVDLFDEVVTDILPALFVAGGRIALKIIDGIVHQLKRGKDAVRDALSKIGIGSTSSDDDLSSYRGGGGAVNPMQLSKEHTYQQDLKRALAQGYESFTMDQWQEANYSNPYKTSGNGGTTINISGKEVLDPIDTAREVDRVINHGMAGVM